MSGIAPGDATSAASASVAAHVAGADPHPQYQKESEKGAANGYAELDAGGEVPFDQLPGATATERGAIVLAGDLTGSAAVPLVAAGAINFARMANLGTDRLIGRDTAGTGDPESLTVSGGVEFSGAGGIQRSALTGDVTAPAGSTTTTIAKLDGAWSTVSTTLTTGTAQPLSIADAVMAGKAAGGSVSGNGVAGVVASSFASAATETGTGAGQAGLGSSPASGYPYPVADFPGQRGILCHLQTSDGDDVVLRDALSTAVDLDDRGAQVYGYLSYRSDLGADLKWRLWFHYRRSADGLEVSFTPDTSLTNCTLVVAEVFTISAMPVGAGLGRPMFGQFAAALGAKAVGTAHLDDGAVTDVQVAAANKDGVAGTASMRTLGTGAQQAAAGNDARITGALQAASDLSDLANAATARTNLAVAKAGTKAGAPGVNDDSSAGYAPGAILADTTVAPRRLYGCSDASVGAAVWVALGLAAALAAPEVLDPTVWIDQSEIGTVSLDEPTVSETVTWSIP